LFFALLFRFANVLLCCLLSRFDVSGPSHDKQTLLTIATLHVQIAKHMASPVVGARYANSDPADLSRRIVKWLTKVIALASVNYSVNHYLRLLSITLGCVNHFTCVCYQNDSLLICSFLTLSSLP
jgi:hypothetical protein